MTWLSRVLAVVTMAPVDRAVIDYASFLSSFYAADLEILHVIEGHSGNPISETAAKAEAQTMYFRLLYRSTELRRSLDQHELKAVRQARLLLKVGRRGEVIYRLATSRRYQVVVVGQQAATTARKLANRSICSVVTVDPDVHIPATTGEDGAFIASMGGEPGEVKHAQSEHRL